MSNTNCNKKVEIEIFREMNERASECLEIWQRVLKFQGTHNSRSLFFNVTKRD